MKSLCKCCFVSLLDSAAGVPEDRCSEILGHAHQTGSVHLHDQVIHLDPTEGKKNQDNSSGRKKKCICKIAASSWVKLLNNH